MLLTISIPGQAIAQDERIEDRDSNETTAYIIIGYFADSDTNPLRFTYLESDVPAYIDKGTTMVPLRALAEGFSYNVTYQDINKEIIIQDSNGENELIFTIDSTTVMQNDRSDTLLQAPVIRNGRTFIPLRYVSEFFGKYVTWKKPNGGEKMFIWVSSAPLLTEVDVAAEKDRDNYYDYGREHNFAMSYYELKKDGHTYRGVKIGYSYEKVIELYGEPHEMIFDDGVLFYINYRTEAYPMDDPGSKMSIYFRDGNVSGVGIDGRPWE
jgi:hypothetical protein